MASNDINSLLTERKVTKAALTRYRNMSQKSDTCNSLLEVQVLLDRTKPLLDKFDAIQSRIEILQSDPEHNELHEQERITFEGAYIRTVANMQQQISNLQPNIQSTARASASMNMSPVSSESQANIKLPRITIPAFDGRYDDWVRYRDTFESLIHNNETLSNIQRFHYLNSSLKGEAARVIRSLGVSDASYELAWSSLKNRYDDPRTLVFHHIDALVQQPKLTKESHTLLRQLIDDTNNHILALKSLNLSNETLGELVIMYIVTQKLDLTTRKEWDKKQGEIVGTPSLRNLMEFLEYHGRFLERSVVERVPNTDNRVQATRSSKGYKPSDRVASYFSKDSSTNSKCSYCKGEHFTNHCEKFLALSVSDRVSAVQSLKICFNCLNPGHRNKECTRSTCRKCSQRHHTLLHREQIPYSPADGKPQASVTLHQGIIANKTYRGDVQVLLPTARILVQDHKGNKIECRALLDSGSQVNFITKQLAKRLHLPSQTANISISGIGRTTSTVSQKTDITISSRINNFRTSLSCLIIPEITDPLPSSHVDSSSFAIPAHIQLADPHFPSPAKIDLLIGSELYWSIMCIGQYSIGKNLPLLQKTLFGWVAGGKAPMAVHSNGVRALCSTVCENLEHQMVRFWEIEHLESNKNQLNENACEQHFRETTTRDENGRFIVRIPTNKNFVKLGESHEMARKRLLSIERKLARMPLLRENYLSFMAEYESLGHMSEITDDNNSLTTPTYYLPHHAVCKETSTTTKVRVVFDGSAKTTSGISLNDVQTVGPVVQDELFAILLRFRKHRYVISADVEKMYRQILVHPLDRPLQSILWRSDPSQPIKAYQLQTVTYGTASAPYLATRVLRQLGEDCSSSYPAASQAIIHDFYVDDLLTGTDNIENAKALKQTISVILKSAGFQLRKWASNEPRVFINGEDSPINVELTSDKDPKTLGLHWNPTSDILRYSVKQSPSRNITKRSILSDISQIFDPLGLVGPVIIQAKIILQRLWQLKITWDESIPQNIFTTWQTFRQELPQLNNILIPRYTLHENAKDIQLHGFCDASEAAYGACIYIRVTDAAGNYHTSLLCAKSRVAPLKAITLPRLELCAAVLLAHLYQKVKEALNLTINEEHFWSDSQVSLHWIKSCPTRWKTFIANRTAEIQRLTNSNWHHVLSHDNPADIISRGTSPTSLSQNKQWWNGPHWLSKDTHQWPHTEEQISDVPEGRSPRQVLNVSVNTFLDILTRYSSWSKLLRVTSYCLRFVDILKSLRNNNKTLSQKANRTPNAQEITRATKIIISLTQGLYFGKELQSLKNNQSISTTSTLISLNPFIDKTGLLRVGGRLHNANIPYDQRHPIILPSKHHVTKLIIDHEHKMVLHAGYQTTMSSIRKKYWPLSCRNTVKDVLRRCIKCYRTKPSTMKYMMGNLPAHRLNPSRPFAVCGVDYAGPIFTKERTRSRTKIKSYICIFVCFVTKAVHIELATDLSTDSFLNCLRRFVSRRGLCEHLYSDNGTNFIGAKNELNELGILLSSNKHNEQVGNFMALRGMQWHFIPPRAPHFGGIWETAVKSAKSHLKRVIGDTVLTFEELYTLLTQVESCMNSRPLFPMSNDPNDLCPLTPGHFLIGGSLMALPHPDLRDVKQHRLSRYQHIQQMLQHFWQRWQTEYLHQLQQRTKWQIDIPSKFGPGTLVLIKEDNLPPLKWKMGRVTEVHPGSDHVIRVVSIKTNDGILKRPVTKLAILPIDKKEEVT